MGPGYWGKTFFMWPPDPRWGNGINGYGSGTGTPNPLSISSTNPVQDTNGNWICDWRQRFFFNTSGGTLNTQSASVNPQILTTGSSGQTLKGDQPHAGELRGRPEVAQDWTANHPAEPARRARGVLHLHSGQRDLQR